MRRSFVTLAVAGALLTGAAAGAWAAAAETRRQLEVSYQNIKIRVDGAEVQSDAEPFIAVDSGRTFTPARPVAEALGARVEWDAAARVVQIYTPGYATVESTAAGQLWRMPGNRIRLATEPRFRQVEAPGALLQLLSEDNQTGVSVVRQAGAPTDANAAVESFLAGLRGISGGVTVLQHISARLGARPATELSLLVKLGAGDFRYWARLAVSDGQLWVVTVYAPAAAAAAQAGAAAAVLDSFEFR